MLVFLYELALASGQFDSFVNAFSLVPCEYSGQCAVFAGTPSALLADADHFDVPARGRDHILGNMLFLFVFGIHVERSMGWPGGLLLVPLFAQAQRVERVRAYHDSWR